MEQHTNVVVGDLGPFPALANLSERWNGWVAAPRFDRATAHAIADAINSDAPQRTGWPCRATVDADGFWYWEKEYAEEYADQRGECYVWDGDGRVAVGAFGWIWAEDE